MKNTLDLPVCFRYIQFPTGEKLHIFDERSLSLLCERGINQPKQSYPIFKSDICKTCLRRYEEIAEKEAECPNLNAP